MKLHKIRKVKKMRGKGMGTHGWGARKKHMGSGHRGGFGMAGSGKRADQKKSLVIKKYDQYFGKMGFTSRSTERKKNNVMNLEYIEKNLESLKKKYEKNGVLELKDYKILGTGEIKSKVIINAEAASESAKKKIEAAGGKLTIKEFNTQKGTSEKVVKKASADVPSSEGKEKKSKEE